MRIKKPQGKEQSYLIFDNRDELARFMMESPKIAEGQEVKVLDASGFMKIEKGWGIFKFDQEKGFFDLIEAEYPASKLTPDENTIYSTKDGVMVSFDDISGTTVDFNYLTDLNISFSVSSYGVDTFIVSMDGSREQTVLGADDHNQKSFILTGNNLSSRSFNNGDGDYLVIYYNEFTNDNPDPITNGTKTKIIRLDQYTPDLHKVSRNKAYIATVLLTIKDGRIVNADSAKVWKHWKNALIPAEYRIKGVQPDNYTIQEINTNEGRKIVSPSDFVGHRHSMRLMKDFDFSIEVSSTGTTLKLSPLGGNAAIPVKLNSSDFYLKIAETTLFTSRFTYESGKFVCWTIYASLESTPNTDRITMSVSQNRDGEPLHIRPATFSLRRVPIAQVRCQLPYNVGGSLDQNKIIINKLWKKALAPAEERITLPTPPPPEPIRTDDTTIYKYPNGTLFVPDAKKCYRHDIFIKEDFDFKFDYSDPTKIVATPIGADQNGVKLVKAEIAGAEKLIKLNRLELYVSSRNWDGLFCSWYVMAHIVEDASGKSMSAGASINGLPTLFSPDGSTINVQQVGIFSLVVRKPYEGQQWRTDSVQLYKWWKQIVLPSESVVSSGEAIPPDEVTIKVVDGKLKAMLPTVLPPDGVTIKIKDGKLVAQMPTVTPPDNDTIKVINNKLTAIQKPNHFVGFAQQGGLNSVMDLHDNLDFVVLEKTSAGTYNLPTNYTNTLGIRKIVLKNVSNWTHTIQDKNGKAIRNLACVAANSVTMDKGDVFTFVYNSGTGYWEMF